MVMMRFKLVLAATTLMASMFASPQTAQAQGFYVNPYGTQYSSNYDPYSGYGFSGVPYSSYYDRHRHFGPHKKLHWTRQEGIHWGRHYGRHHAGRHDLRYPVWY